MAILPAELKLYPSSVISDAGTNGGRINDTAVLVTNTVNGFPPVTPSELLAGLTRYRKFFYRVENADSLTFADAGVCMGRPVPTEGRGYIFAATMTDVQSGISSPDLYGAAQLDDNASATDTDIDVVLEDSSDDIFRDDMRIRISDGTNTEIVTIDTAGTPSGSVQNLTLTSALANSYTASNTYVGSILEAPADIEGTISNASDTSASGTLDDSQIVVGWIGAVYMNITITMTDANNFTAADDVLGSLGSGSALSPFAPTNPNTGTAYFTIPAPAWGGTRVAAETFSFRVNPAAMALWAMLVYDAAATAGSGALFNLIPVGYSA